MSGGRGIGQQQEQKKKVDETKKKTDATTTETKKKIEIVIVNSGVFNYVLPTVGTRATYYLVCIAIHCSLDISRNIPLEHSLPMVEKFPL